MTRLRPLNPKHSLGFRASGSKVGSVGEGIREWFPGVVVLNPIDRLHTKKSMPPPPPGIRYVPQCMRSLVENIQS